jgi:hypothetical protein
MLGERRSDMAEAASLFRRRKSSTMARSLSVMTFDCDGEISWNSIFAHIASNWPEAFVSPCNAWTQRFSKSASRRLT